MRRMIMLAGMLALAACGPAVSTTGIDPRLGTAAAVADATLPPPILVSPTAKSLVDDYVVQTAFDALDLARAGVDTAIALKPSIIGTPAALRVANGLSAAKWWLNAARSAQLAGQAESYTAALQQAASAMKAARTGIAELKGQ